MERIENREGLELLEGKISAAHRSISLRPNLPPFWAIFSAWNPALNEVCDHNNKVYATLPQSVPVSAETAVFLAANFTEYNNKKAGLYESAFLAGLFKALQFTGAVASSAIAPNPFSAAMVAKGFYSLFTESSAQKKMGDVENELNPILRSYRLCADETGNFSLERASWTFSWITTSVGSRGVEISRPQIYVSGTGVSSDITKHEPFASFPEKPKLNLDYLPARIGYTSSHLISRFG